MTKQNLDSYRFLSGKEPTDEMLESIMRDALDVALERKTEADKKYKAEVQLQREKAKKEWTTRLNNFRHGRI